MAMVVNSSNIQEAITAISEHGFDGMGDALRILFNQAMHAYPEDVCSNGVGDSSKAGQFECHPSYWL